MNVEQNSLSHYHKALLATSASTILQSGLLLDEDLQILINFYKHDPSITFPVYTPSLFFRIGLASFVGSLVLANRFTKWLVLPSTMMATVATVVEVKQSRKITNRKEIVENVVNISKKINTLNSSIKKYLKTRIDIKDKSQNEFFQGYNIQTHEFLKNMRDDEKMFVVTIMNNLEILTNYSDNLKDDFNLFKDFKPLDKVQLENIEDGLKFIIQVQDLHIWIISKLLSYISTVSLGPNNKLDAAAVNTLFDVTLDSLLRFLKNHYEVTRKSFASLRSSVHTLQQIRTAKNDKPIISNKLQNTLMSALDNISIIYEKSQTILTRLEVSESESSEHLDTALLDLRNHTYAAYESVDLLCRLYGILTSQKIPAEEAKVIQVNSNTAKLPTINYDDDVNVVEENYELYLDKDYEESVEESRSHKDESSAYLGLMLAELQQSLKKHERFIEAKKKRGSVDLKEIVEKEEVPCFNLDELKCDVKNEDNKEVDNGANAAVASLSVVEQPISPVPPPPPPPMIPKVFQLDDVLPAEPHSRSMFEGIKMLSSQLARDEEVFGESGEEDEDD
ncbi:uncharacterized protein LOC114333637 [Diabrotica virgifera virgifera]|uniref:Myosin-binding domain-containing protein n=1 Tax=Diabrotica virgifera virgifera TaxID=50390 RepID=A0ABM5IR70_DIAVI|nr:uncharacterized protein LOC114333637 [Diabrotica virgifera virgifera]